MYSHSPCFNTSSQGDRLEVCDGRSVQVLSGGNGTGSVEVVSWRNWAGRVGRGGSVGLGRSLGLARGRLSSDKVSEDRLVDLQCALCRQPSIRDGGFMTYLGLRVDQVGEESKLDSPVLSCSR